jgi:hypothetical protein
LVPFTLGAHVRNLESERNAGSRSPPGGFAPGNLRFLPSDCACSAERDALNLILGSLTLTITVHPLPIGAGAAVLTDRWWPLLFAFGHGRRFFALGSRSRFTARWAFAAHHWFTACRAFLYSHDILSLWKFIK